MKETLQLPITNEIASVIWAKKCTDDGKLLAEIKADPAKAFDESASSFSMRVRAVQNTADTLHVCVPDYQGLNDSSVNDSSVDEISDEQMAGVSGGLLFLFMPLIAAAVAAAPAAIAVASASGAAGVAAAGAAGAATAVGAGVGGAAATGALET